MAEASIDTRDSAQPQSVDDVKAGEKFSYKATQERLNKLRSSAESDQTQVRVSAADGNILAKRIIAEIDSPQKIEHFVLEEGDYFQVTEPIGKKTFTSATQHDTANDLSVYAEFVATLSNGESYRSALVRVDDPDIPYDQQPNHFFLVPYTENTAGERIYTSRREIVKNGEVGSHYIRVDHVGNLLFNVSPMSDATKHAIRLDAVVPSQKGRRAMFQELLDSGDPIAQEIDRKRKKSQYRLAPKLSAEPITWEEKQAKEVVESAAERFPDDTDFDIAMHRGGYEVDEAYTTAIKQQIKGSWMLLSEGLGLDPKDFPLETVDVWAPKFVDKRSASYRNRVRNVIHRLRPKASIFDTANIFAVKGSYSFNRIPPRNESLNIPLPASGTISFGNAAHELFHAYLNHRGIFATVSSLKDYGKVTDEGLGVIADSIIIPEAYSGGKFRIAGNGFLESDFSNMIARSQEKEIENVKEEESLDSDNYAYSFANAVLHYYLLKERGGFDKMRELTQQDTKKRLQLLNAYKKTYGESFPELLVKAKEWFDLRS